MTIDLDLLSVHPRFLVRSLRNAGYRPEAPQVWGPGSGLHVRLLDGDGRPAGTVVVSQSPGWWPGADPDVEWLHASIAWRDRDPTYADLVALKAATFGPDRVAYQVFAVAGEHVSIHDHALHLWGRADGQALLPSFGVHGTI